MKQKNLLLVVLAAGCGLAAAFLTSRMSAKTVKVEETIPVLVASRDLPIGTKLKKEDIDSYLETKEFTKETVPPVYIATKDELADKRVVRTLRKGDAFNPQDVTKVVTLNPPPGFNMMTIPCSLEQGAAGFASPGTKVDVLAAIPCKDKRRGHQGEQGAYVVPLMVDMLVLAINSQAQINPEVVVDPTLNMVSFAVTAEQSLLLHAAINKNSSLRLVLRNADKPPVYEKLLTHAELWSILANEPRLDDTTDGEPTEDKEQKVKLPVAKAEIPAGTKITKDVVDTKFEMKEFTKPLPPEAVEDLRDFYGKVLTSKLSAGQFVPKSFLGEKELVKPAPAPADGPAPKPAPRFPKEGPKKAEAPPVYHDFTVQTPNGVKKYRYQKLPNGEFKFLGEVPHDGNADKVPDADEPKAAPKKPDAKPEPKADPDAPKADKRGEPVSAPAAA